MELTTDVLCRTEWVERAEGGGVRMKFRRDGTGFYEREGAPGTRFVRENLLHRLEGAVLKLKFAHAREWTEVGVSAQANDVVEGTRFGARELVFTRDPYAWAMEERPTESLRLVSDAGAQLPS